MPRPLDVCSWIWMHLQLNLAARCNIPPKHQWSNELDAFDGAVRGHDTGRVRLRTPGDATTYLPTICQFLRKIYYYDLPQSRRGFDRYFLGSQTVLLCSEVWEYDRHTVAYMFWWNFVSCRPCRVHRPAILLSWSKRCFAIDSKYGVIYVSATISG